MAGTVLFSTMRRYSERLRAISAVTFSNAECAFGYRESRFKYLDRGRYIILAVTFRLPRGNAPIIRYGEVDRQLAAAGIVRPTLAELGENPRARSARLRVLERVAEESGPLTPPR